MYFDWKKHGYFSLSLILNNMTFKTRQELDPLNNVPDDPSTLSPRHSLTVLLLGLLLRFHNTIIVLAFYMPEEQQAQIFRYTHLSNPGFI